jgi:hypothetical protein
MDTRKTADGFEYDCQVGVHSAPNEAWALRSIAEQIAASHDKADDAGYRIVLQKKPTGFAADAFWKSGWKLERAEASTTP